MSKYLENNAKTVGVPVFDRSKENYQRKINET